MDRLLCYCMARSKKVQFIGTDEQKMEREIAALVKRGISRDAAKAHVEYWKGSVGGRIFYAKEIK